MTREFRSPTILRFGANNPHRTGRSVLNFSWTFNAAVLIVVTLVLALGVWAQ
ncbi:MAG: hypothetical protein LR120_08325 [Dehalococcoidia bacterium]|nr:hypothetical protein [Dehalococcoidia bacterium]